MLNPATQRGVVSLQGALERADAAGERGALEEKTTVRYYNTV